jgi:hypothetical protein
MAASSKAAGAVANTTEKMSGNNLTIVLVLISLLVLGITGLAAKALLTGIIRDTKVVTAKLKAEQQLKKDLEAAPKLVEAYQNLGPQSSVLSNALPNSADFPSLIVTLENMTTTSGVKLKTVSPIAATTTQTTPAPAAAASGAKTPQGYDFSITFDGTLDGLKHLLGDLETSARPMRVTAVSINGSDSSLSGEIDVQTYWQDKAELPFETEIIK